MIISSIVCEMLNHLVATFHNIQRPVKSEKKTGDESQ